MSYEPIKGTHTTVQDILEIVGEILGVLCLQFTMVYYILHSQCSHT